eukprot:Rmarinus@m.22278
MASLARLIGRQLSRESPSRNISSSAGCLAHFQAFEDKNQNPVATATILARKHNTFIHVANEKSETLSSMSAGCLGYKGAKQRDPMAAFHLGKEVAAAVRERGHRWCHVKFKGFGPGREEALRGLQAGGLLFLRLTDATPIPHNGSRPPVRRRI